MTKVSAREETIELSRVRLRAVQVLGRKQLDAVADRIRIQIFEQAGDALAIDLSTYIMGMEGERIVINKRWPCDWWQALRERWFPKWWLRRRPVQYEEIDIDEQKFAAVCPHIAIDTPLSEHIVWMAEQK